MLTNVVLYTVTVLLVLGGMVVLHVAAFADRSKGRPRCPRCWYDMTGSRGFVCPECGHDAAGQSNLHRTRRHGARAMLGALLVVSGLTLGAVPTVQEQGWTALIPTTGLMIVLPWTDNEWVFEEVDARVTATNPQWFARRRHRQDVSTMTIFYARRCAALLGSQRSDALRLKAVQMLFDLGVRDAHVEQVLVEAIKDLDTTISTHALRALSQVAANEGLVDADACARAVARCLQDSRPLVSSTAARFLRDLDPPPLGALPDLIAALDDERREVRGEACQALSRFNEKAQPAVPALIRLIDDSSERVSMLAIIALSRVGEAAAAAVEPISAAARVSNRRGEAAIAALGRLGTTAAPAIPCLSEILLGAGEEPHRRTAAAAALLAINPYDQTILDAIERASREDIEPLRLLIARQITQARANEPQQVRIVLGFFASEFPEVRREAALALGRLAPLRPHEVDLLTAYAEDQTFIGCEEAQSALSRVLEQPNTGEQVNPQADAFPTEVGSDREHLTDPGDAGR